MRSFVLYSFTLCFIPFVLRAQYNEEYELINTRNGLSHNIVLSIFQDSKGYMWLGTMDGLCKYDGNRFTVFLSKGDVKTLPNNIVHCIYESTNGLLWVGARSNGFASYNRKTGAWTAYKPQTSIAGGNANINDFCEDRHGNIWVAEEAGIACGLRSWNNEYTFRRALTVPDRYLQEVFVDSADRLLYVDYDNLCRRDLHRKQRPAVWVKGVSKFRNDPEGNLYLIKGNRICYLDTRTNSIRFFNDGHFDNKAKLALYVNKAGKLLAADNKRLVVYDRDGTICASYELGTNEKLKGQDKINCIYEDRTGIIWLGTDMGIVKIIPARFPFRKLNLGAPGSCRLSYNYVRALYTDRNNTLWIGYKDGIIDRMDRSQKRCSITGIHPDGHATVTVNTMFQTRSGNMLFGSAAGLYSLAKQKDRLVFIPNTPFGIWSLFEDSAGYIWLGTHKQGLFLKDLHTGELRNMEIDPLNGLSVWTIYKDQGGGIWLGTSNGLYELVERREHGLKFILHTHGEDGSSLLGNEVWNIVEDNYRNFWIGTSKGLNYWNRKNNSFTHYTEKDGLVGEVIRGLLMDGKGNLWVGTMNGLSRFTVADSSFWNFREEDGLISNDFNFKTCIHTKDGEIYWGSKVGISAFYPADIHPELHTGPDVQISALKIFDRLFRTEPSSGSHITLHHDDHFFSIEFALLEYAGLMRHKFRYMLEGFDKQWRYTDQQVPVAYYTNVPYGNYTFIVQGSADGNKWTDNNTFLYIDITPALWQTISFKVLLSIVLLGAAGAVIYFRLRSIIRREKEKSDTGRKIAGLELRALQAQMNPHFVFNAINAIQQFFINRDERMANQYLSKFASLMRFYLESSKKKYITLEEEMELLELYIQLEKLRFNDKFDYAITIDHNIEPHATDIPSMLIQPFVENAINHGLILRSECGMLLLSFTLREKMLLCTIDDNGIGRQEAARIRNNSVYQHRSRGMEIVNERLAMFEQLEEWKIKINIADKTDQDGNPSGTCVEILIPYLNDTE